MIDKNMVAYYVEYLGKDGHNHYAINLYCRSTGWVWRMDDYKF